MVHRSHLVIFYFKEKFCVSQALASLLRDVYCLKHFEDLVEESFIQTVKCFFFKLLFIKVSVARRSRLVYFLLQGKVPSFARLGKSLARCLFLKCSEDLVEKIVSPVLFDTNRSLKW